MRKEFLISFSVFVSPDIFHQLHLPGLAEGTRIYSVAEGTRIYSVAEGTRIYSVAEGTRIYSVELREPGYIQ